MPRPDADDLDRAVRSALEVLRGAVAAGADWQRPAGDLEWSCRETVAHVAHDLVAYATQLVGRRADPYLPVDLAVRADASPEEVLDAVAASAALLTTVLRAAPPSARAWHWGPTDATGFAALALDEVLVHTWDVTRGLDLGWHPPDELAALVVDRLFPGAPAGAPGDVLLWCTGRRALADRPRQRAWSLRAAVG